MDIDFVVQDTFALTRPQWKLAANFEEAGSAFAEMVKQNYKTQEPEKPIESEQPEDEPSSDEDVDDEDINVPDMDDAQSSDDEAENELEGESEVIDRNCDEGSIY